MNEYNSNGRVGWYKDNDNLITFSLGNNTPMSETTGVIELDKFSNISTPIVYNIAGYNTLLKGSNNRLPEELISLIGGNRLLPKVIEKQVKMLYGKGPRVYKEVFENGRLRRVWEKQKKIEDWLDSWQENGLQDSSKEFSEKIIRDSYYSEDYWVKWRFNKGRRIGSTQPIVGLEHVDNKRARLATKKTINQFGDDLIDSDFNQVITGNWNSGIERTYKIYNRLRPSNVLNNDVAISYHKNSMPGQIYGINKFYFGIKDWLIGTNRNPQYINSYLENSLNAKVHVQIPWEWVKSIEKKIEDYCAENAKRKELNQSPLVLNAGGEYEIEIGTEYHVGLRDKYISTELKRLSKFLSGVKNQGKLYATFSFQTTEGEVAWKIIPVDLKYREFITALLDYDSRSDEVITSSIGVPPEISNLSKDGIISQSGADIYYNYIIYLHNLTLDEELCTEPYNLGVKYNFNSLYREGYRIGFYNEIPSRQEDVSPNDRLQNTLNNAISPINNQVKSIVDQLNKIQQMVTIN